jgi:hypothetical protein
MNDQRQQREETTREEVQQRLAMILAIADDPATVFCVQPFTSVERDGGKHLGRLLARVMGDPDRGLLVATKKAFVFAFKDQLEQSKSNALREDGAH